MEEACGDRGREGQRLIGNAPDTGQSGDVHVVQVENTHKKTEAARGEREDDTESIESIARQKSPSPLVRRSTLSRLSSKTSVLELDESEESSWRSSASSGRSHASRNSVVHAVEDATACS